MILEIHSNLLEKLCDKIVILDTNLSRKNFNIISPVFPVFLRRGALIIHIFQGGCPSPFDRNQATKLAARALEFLIAKMKEGLREADKVVVTNDASSAVLLGIVDRHLCFTPVVELESETDFAHRIPKVQWWLKLRPLLRLLAKHDSNYETTSVATEEVELGY